MLAFRQMVKRLSAGKVRITARTIPFCIAAAAGFAILALSPGANPSERIRLIPRFTTGESFRSGRDPHHHYQQHHHSVVNPEAPLAVNRSATSAPPGRSRRSIRLRRQSRHRAHSRHLRESPAPPPKVTPTIPQATRSKTNTIASRAAPWNSPSSLPAKFPKSLASMTSIPIPPPRPPCAPGSTRFPQREIAPRRHCHRRNGTTNDRSEIRRSRA